MRRGRPNVLFVAWLALVPPAGALAQGGGYEEARTQAVEAYKSGDYARAAELFRQAFEIEPKGNLLYNIAVCYDKAGNAVDAVTWYQKFVDAVPDSPKRPEVTRRIAELREQLDDAQVEVSVSTSPAGALVFVDDKARGAMGVSPLSFTLLPGSYVIIAEKEGHEPARQKIQVARGAPVRVDLNLLPKGMVGTVALRIPERGADVLVDGKRVGASPLAEPLRLSQGPHELLVMKSGFAPWKQTIDVQGGRTATVAVTLVPEGGDGMGGIGAGGGAGIWPWVTMGAGVAAIGGAVFTGLSAQSLHDQLDQKRRDGEPIAPQDVDTGNTLVMTTNVLYGVGAAAIAGGALWWLLGGDAGGATGLTGSVGPVPDGGAAVRLEGAF